MNEETIAVLQRYHSLERQCRATFDQLRHVPLRGRAQWRPYFTAAFEVKRANF